MSVQLPSQPHLAFLKKQAKDILRVSRSRAPRWRLCDAQHALARGYGFRTWAQLKHQIETDGAGPAASQFRSMSRGSAPTSVTHPLEGTWECCGGDLGTDAPVTEMLAAFAVTLDAMTVTQIWRRTSGDDVATRMTIAVDGQSHPLPVGNGLAVTATWLDSRTLRTVFRQHTQLLAESIYAVSPDGSTLTVATQEGPIAARTLIFRRVA